MRCVRLAAFPVALLLALLPFLLLLGAASAQPAPGEVLELTPSGTLSPGGVDGRTQGRFRNDGETPPSARYTVDTYLLRYASTSVLPGEAGVGPVEITAQLFVPRLGGDAERTELFAFAPGSTGLVEACAPSRSFVDGGGYQTYNAYTLAYAGQGFVSIMPNYAGFFDVGTIQPYFVREAEGRVVLDALRAALAALERLEPGYTVDAAFVGGYSQGGHAAFAAADLHADYAPDVPLAGILGFGATTDLENLFLEFTYVAPWVVYSYETFFPERIDPDALLLPAYARDLVADAERLCVLGAQSFYPSAPGGLFLPEVVAALEGGALADLLPETAALLAENDAGLGGHALPSMLLQGVNDPVVSIESQNEFVARLCEDGSPVRYPNYLRTRHETRYIGFPDAIDWMRALAAGEAPPSDCAALAAGPEGG